MLDESRAIPAVSVDKHDTLRTRLVDETLVAHSIGMCGKRDDFASTDDGGARRQFGSFFHHLSDEGIGTILTENNDRIPDVGRKSLKCRA